MRSAALALLLLLLAGCDYDPRGRCAVVAECPSGQVCAGGLCAAPAPSPPNDAPVATPDAYTVLAGQSFVCPAALGLLANDSDPDGDPLEAERVDPPSRGVVYVEPSGAFRYWPDTELVAGTVTFTYRASDGALRSAVTTVTLDVTVP